MIDVENGPTAPGEIEPERRRRRWANLLLAAFIALGGVLSVTGPSVSGYGVTAAVICGVCALVALVAALRGR
ncbi:MULTISPECIES: hypothetical protein [unclassified Rathayibacter]|uniref:hypothetical protein n=1 Tax=unclassified Rathayibacter TaxID=2609250 RepID=UPI00188D3F78|nr:MULTISPECIES: hypothetical protein [unclassified Rathayibacter]MBF4461839.1 hypothetical protein [Rathayibacter sp. VKM Ac-2879]MBF4503252.1 hypothetical protein [Rathayibacter sp. VKM Ac-2878]